MDTAPRPRTGQSANDRFMKKHGKSIARMIAQREISSGQDEIAATASNRKKTVDLAREETESTYNKRGMSWDEAIETFRIEKATAHPCSESTLRKYLAHLECFKAFLKNVKGIDRIYLSQVKREHVTGFIWYLINDLSLTLNTVNHYTTTLKLFYNTLVKAGYIAFNPIFDIKKQTIPEKEFPSFTLSHIQLLLEQPNKRTWDGYRDYALLMLLVDTGCRISEALLLKVEDIRRDEEGRPVEVVFRMTKKKKKLREVALTDSLSDALESWLQWRARLRLRDYWEGDVERDRYYHKPLPGNKPAEYVFTNDKGNMLSRNTWRDRLKRYCALAGLHDVPNWTSHTLRHSYGKITLESGCDVAAVMKTMGHSSLEMVSLYAESVGKELRDVSGQ